MSERKSEIRLIERRRIDPAIESWRTFQLGAASTSRAAYRARDIHYRHVARGNRPRLELVQIHARLA